jgi:hypothetical protein
MDGKTIVEFIREKSKVVDDLYFPQPEVTGPDRSDDVRPPLFRN